MISIAERVVAEPTSFGAENESEWRVVIDRDVFGGHGTRVRGESQARATHRTQEFHRRVHGHPHDRQEKDFTHRDANRSAVVRIGTSLVEHESVDVEGPGRASDGPEVLVVVQSFEDGDAMPVSGSRTPS